MLIEPVALGVGLIGSAVYAAHLIRRLAFWQHVQDGLQQAELYANRR